MKPTDFSKTGKSIDYEPGGEIEDGLVIPGSDIGSTEENVTISKNTTDPLTWKIWGEDADNIYIIANEITNELPLKGVEGVNNGVYYSDLLVENLYANTNYQTQIDETTGNEIKLTARALKIEDIEYIIDKTKFDYTKDGECNVYDILVDIQGINREIPKVIGEMRDNVVVNNRSIQNKIYSGSDRTRFSSKLKSNYWTMAFESNYFINEEFYYILKNGYSYFLSSRYIQGRDESSLNGYGMMRLIDRNSLINGAMLLGSDKAEIQQSLGVRPVIIIPKSICNIRQGGNNGETYHIEPKG